MSEGLTIAAITVSVTGIGWFVTAVLQSVRESRNRKIAAVVDYTERQLAELYGPLVALLIEGEQAYLACLQSLGQSHDELEVALGIRGPTAGICILNDEQLKT